MFRRRTYRRAARRVPRALSAGSGALYLVRSGTPTAVTITNGAVHGSYNPKLSDVVNSDLQAVFSEFRLVKCVVTFILRQDPSAANAAGFRNFNIACASDPENTTPTAFNEVTSFANHRRGTLQSAQGFKYTFVPKATFGAAVGGAGVFRQNPWMLLNSSISSALFNNLMYSIISTDTVASTFVADYVIDYHFLVRGIN